MASDRYLGTALTVLLAMSAVACGDGSEAPATNPVASSASPVLTLPTDPTDMPDVTPDGFDGLLADVSAGTPVVVNFWGSWCGPCRREAPILAAAARRYEGAVQFIGVDVLDTQEAARRFVEEFDIPYPNVFDPSATGDVRTSFGLTGQPATLFINYGGEESYRWEGEISEEQLDRAIRPLLPSA